MYRSTLSEVAGCVVSSLRPQAPFRGAPHCFGSTAIVVADHLAHCAYERTGPYALKATPPVWAVTALALDLSIVEVGTPFKFGSRAKGCHERCGSGFTSLREHLMDAGEGTVTRIRTAVVQGKWRYTQGLRPAKAVDFNWGTFRHPSRRQRELSSQV